MRTKGFGKVAYSMFAMGIGPWRSRFVCLSFHFAVVFNFNEFPFVPRKSKLMGDFLINRQNVACFFSFITIIAY
jgi:hypothetical protein